MQTNAAQRAGFRAGYQDGLNNIPYAPKAKLIKSITHDVYLKIYLSHYDVGYNRGRADRGISLSLNMRRETLLQNRDKPEASERQR